MKQDTNNQPDKSPVDDLFARRLGQHSIAPDKAGWEKLQAKMTGKPEARVVVFWRNPTVHRYAAAACVSALLLTGGWLLLRPTDDVSTRQNQMATTATGQKTRQTNAIKGRRGNADNRVANQQIAAQEPANQQSMSQQSVTSSVSKRTEKLADQTKWGANQSGQAAKPVDQYADDQVVKIETTPTSISLITVPTKPVAEQVLIVTIAEPDALIEARQAANWSESAEKTLAVDVVQKPAKSGKFLQQVARVRNGNGIELAGDADQGLLSRAFQTIKNKTNNKSLKQ